MPVEALFLARSVVDLSLVLLAARIGAQWLYGTIAINFLLIGFFGAKIISQFGVTTNIGNIFYASIFFATYLIYERHGKKAALQTIYFGCFVLAFFYLVSQIAAQTPGLAASAAINSAISVLVTFAPHSILGSFVAFIFAQYINISIYHYLYERFKGKYLWLRVNAASIVAQMIDSLFFFTITFFDASGGMLLQLILAGWLIKSLAMLVGTPLMYLDAFLNKKNRV